MGRMDIPFAWIDVFAERPLTGNPLALIPDADGLSDEQMRAIAREFNQSEATFVCRATAAGADLRLRSFTPAGVEVGGAGHNAMGAWVWLAASGRLEIGRRDFVQEIGDELLPVRVEGRGAGARVTMEQSPPAFAAGRVDADALAAALGLGADALAAAPEVGSTGAAHLLVPLVDRGAVDAAAPDRSALKELLAGTGAEGCYIYTSRGRAGERSAAYARFFNPTVGIAEDPATGTAAGPLAALLVRDGVADDGSPVLIEQGHALGRPSLLTVTVTGDRVELAGSGVVAATGALHL
jgi:trans-2,3-dihydro-3-hydroxyanthranilate isomerase